MLLYDASALEFFNELSAVLDLKLTETPPPDGATAPWVTVESARLDVATWCEASGSYRALTDDELNLAVFTGDRIALQGLSGIIIPHESADGLFKVSDLLTAIESTERQTRADIHQPLPVDRHHVFFEGMEEHDTGVWTVYWGS